MTQNAEADFADGNARMQISGSKSRNFYLRVARRFFGGSKERPAVDELLVTALGTAMNSAVAISDSLVKNQVATVVNIETSYYKSEDESRGTSRSIPKLSIKMKKNPDWKYEPEDEKEGEHDDTHEEHDEAEEAHEEEE
ncbi:unnamed protein product [Vitrella brassicaformis CCMP3155]|uniref:DNA/RNA-binding protein Alba-like domain-containing protein n=1 Tax=Vitrella brassicaformis (strain CCMP3155) TaxID=1169540 RepID=A0A0G4FCV8_VITBC|nr:unnamed protein product [Vitrella brassicaformis CCMP3155]|eukprot:CEM11006.1 unnamed protein product [Vitrella brassicaformis CCMP3155]